MEAFISHEKGCLLDCLDWVPNQNACIDACFVWWRDTLLSASRYKALQRVIMAAQYLLVVFYDSFFGWLQYFHPCSMETITQGLFQILVLDHLFVKVPQPGDSERTF